MKVLVAMSGGVDSSVAAALLVQQGHQVIGATMQVWDYCDLEAGSGSCCSSLDVDDARSVADRLNIPFYVINCEAQFKTSVIDPFVQSYLQGQTPVPCVNCNTFLKFDYLIKKMHELECDYLATGHYASIENSGETPTIITSEDSYKDQTYFLFTLQKSVLKHLMFPIGHLKKPQVRILAEEFGLINARKKDSTGICFVGKGDYAEFVSRHADPASLKPGLIRRHPEGEILGRHNGIHHFTYGQRRGLGMDYHETLFVLSTDPKTNTVWVGDEKFLYSKELSLKDCNWLDSLPLDEDVTVKIRYAHRGSKARIIEGSQVEGQGLGEKIKIMFHEPQRAVTPGQAAVFYRDRQLMGGGWIE